MKSAASFILIGICTFMGAASATCDGPYSFACDDSTCISFARVCDGKQDCQNGEDELSARADCDSVRQCMRRNDSAVKANGYRCRRSCNLSDPRPCAAPNKQCICDDECGYSCINPKAPCPPFPPIDHSTGYEIVRFNGTSKVTVPQGGPFKYGDMIKYTCEEGTSLTGHLERCNAAKTWSSLIPRCIDNIVDNDFCASQPCENGGTCLNNGEEYECLCPRSFTGVNCETATSARCRQEQCNGRGTCYTSSEGQQECKCDPGFYAYACEGEYTCSRKKIPDRGYIIEELQLEGKKDEWKYGEKATIRCLEGYELEGAGNYTCSEKGYWTEGKTKCIRMFCMLDYYLMPEDTVVKGYENFESLYSHKFNVGDVAIVGCRDGMLGDPVPSLPLNCTRGGKWIPHYRSITCRPQPETLCNYPVLPDYSSLTEENESGQFVVGSVLTLQCEEGYDIAGEENITCLSDGTWSEYSQCIETATEKPQPEVVCDYPALPDFSMLRDLPESTQFLAGSILTLVCLEGYDLDGDETITCHSNGTWSQHPMCVEIIIENPPPDFVCHTPELSEGVVFEERPEVDEYDEGAVIRLQCQEGYELSGNDNIVCQDDGAWSDGPICENIPSSPTCSPDQSLLAEGVAIAQNFESETFEIGDSIELYCLKTDFHVSARHLKFLVNTTTCTDDGKWEPALEDIQCVRVCRSPPQREDGITVLSSRSEFFFPNDTLHPECPPRHRHVGSNEIRCLENGTWTEMTQCEPVGCWIDPSLLHASVSIVGHPNERLVSVEFPITTQLDIKCAQEGHTIRNRLPQSITCNGKNVWSIDYKSYLCHHGTCINRCLSKDADLCACDFECEFRGDCCDDFSEHCKK